MPGISSRRPDFQLPMSAYITFDNTPSSVAATFVGTAILPTLVYGINSTLIFITLHLLWRDRTADTRKRTLLMTSYIVLYAQHTGC